MESGRISISEIRDHYGIEQSTAYKWRTALRNLGMEEEWSNYDLINSREINLAEALKRKSSEGAIAIVENSAVVESSTPPPQPQAEDVAYGERSLFGISPQRLAEINSTVELEVMVEDALYEHHRQKRRAERAQQAAQAVREVAALDPKKIVEIAMTQISQVQSGIVA